MAKGYLRLIILALTAVKEQSGYSLIKGIYEKTHCWKPSTGSVYPILDSMAKEGLLEVQDSKEDKCGKGMRKKTYRITQKGKDTLRAHCGDKDELRKGIIEKMQILMAVSEDKQVNGIISNTISKIEGLR